LKPLSSTISYCISYRKVEGKWRGVVTDLIRCQSNPMHTLEEARTRVIALALRQLADQVDFGLTDPPKKVVFEDEAPS
jgi:hypothetical protein